ncbi:MAG: transcription-repair coupling factor [Lachnospiraceae bacterium]|nr:transcription-repair coupling factor [Lachnospiraceae bacterium]
MNNQTFLQPLNNLSEIETLKEGLKKKRKFFGLSGTISAAISHLVYGIGEEYAWKVVVSEEESRAAELCEEYRFFDEDCVYFPAKDLLFYQSDIRSNALSRDRIRALADIVTKDRLTIFTTMDALMNRMPTQTRFLENILHIRKESQLNLKKIAAKLTQLGYENVSCVEGPGEFSIRGGILDVFSMTEDNPVRIELWGDEVDSIRCFDAASQKSLENIEETYIYPATEIALSQEEISAGMERIKKEGKKRYEELRKEMRTEESFHLKTRLEELDDKLDTELFSQETETLLPYFVDHTYSILEELPEDTLVFLEEPAHLENRGKAILEEFEESMSRRMESGYALARQKDMLISPGEIFELMKERPGVMLSSLDAPKCSLKPVTHFYVRMTSITAYQNNFQLLVKELKNYKKQNYAVVMISASRTKAKRIASELMDEGLNSFYSENFKEPLPGGMVMVTAGSLRHGFSYSEGQFAVIAESDIFGSARRKKRRKRYSGEQAIRGFSDLNIGDYIVHENYGLGIYQGMEKIKVDKIQKDYLKIAYAKGSNLYIPASNLDVISKYGHVGNRKPKLNTLGTQDWNRTKSKVRAAVGEVAKELVDLYALRQQNIGHVYGEDTVWQKEFEETFPYEETEGQLAAIEEVKADMMSDKIMDRLICGDVGYGKTEIAIRAAFKAVQENKQVVYLCPTTILAQQHYNTFCQRMKDYPINIEMLSRFRTTAQNKETVARLKKGEVDIVIGTHRVLSKDVAFKDLGLLIIDEEQRFGVTHKERIKQMKKTVDVLSLSATPIPRTLHMSLIGIRDMSVLEEAPLERMPIQTFVFEQNEEMVREAIERELVRGGQVYYVINRVRQIADVAAHLQSLLPDAEVAYAHGQMPETKLEEIMKSFMNKEIDVLVATTIIEIGLDISNVNTIIIHDADQLGLSQLYQLRGRVGRSNRRAYAFLMYKRDKMLKEVAEKRLAAIREFTDLGSGFKIAMRDLEIRGAGNLLGEEQHGHLDAVGYDLYCKMLSEAVNAEKGIEIPEDYNTSVDLDIDAFIPPDYITDEMQKLDIYKRIAGIINEEERSLMLDELIDRYGDPPSSVENLLDIALLKAAAHSAYVVDVKQKEGYVRLSLLPEAKIDPLPIPDLLQEFSPYAEFHADKEEPAFLIRYEKDNRFPKKEMVPWLKNFIRRMTETLVES